MKSVNLIYYNNGVGLTNDSIILKTHLGSQFIFNDVDISKNNCPDADINLFIQNLDINSIKFIHKAKTNVMIPNIEWLDEFCISNLDSIDTIFAKSKGCYNTLSNFHNNVIYTGFASIDRYHSNITKSNSFFHHAGRSIQKNTELVVDVFNKINLPITIVDATQRFLYKTNDNINYIPHFLSESEINHLYNSNRYHICCSLSEGWGHYIYEALSCKSTVITTNSTPMKDNLSNKECFLLDCKDQYKYDSPFLKNINDFPFRKPNFVDKFQLLSTIRHVLNYDTSNIENNARFKYEQICESFKTIINEEFSKL